MVVPNAENHVQTSLSGALGVAETTNDVSDCTRDCASQWTGTSQSGVDCRGTGKSKSDSDKSESWRDWVFDCEARSCLLTMC